MCRATEYAVNVTEITVTSSCSRRLFIIHTRPITVALKREGESVHLHLSYRGLTRQRITIHA